MRLIDADRCPCKDCGSMDDWCQHTCGMFKEWLNTPAYDVDKVVEELKDSSIEYEVFGMSVEFVGKGSALDIVQRGGVDDIRTD